MRPSLLSRRGIQIPLDHLSSVAAPISSAEVRGSRGNPTARSAVGAWPRPGRRRRRTRRSWCARSYPPNRDGGASPGARPRCRSPASGARGRTRCTASRSEPGSIPDPGGPRRQKTPGRSVHMSAEGSGWPGPLFLLRHERRIVVAPGRMRTSPADRLLDLERVSRGRGALDELLNDARGLVDS
jgi:hypothetical protein